MSGLYPDLNEDPQQFLDRLTRSYQRHKLRPEDRAIFDAGVASAQEQIARRDHSNHQVKENGDIRHLGDGDIESGN